MDLQWIMFSATGRMNRKPYWLVGLCLGVVAMVVTFIAQAMNAPAVSLLALVVYVPLIFMMIKRAHDRDRSGLFILLALIPLVNLWVAIEIAFLPGTPGPNRFGPNPLATAGAPVAYTPV